MRDAGHRVRGARVARLIRRSVADPWRVFFFPFRFGLSSSRPPLGSLGSARGREHDTRRSMITQTIVLTKACGQTTIDYNSMRPHGWTGSFPRFVFFFGVCPSVCQFLRPLPPVPRECKIVFLPTFPEVRR